MSHTVNIRRRIITTTTTTVSDGSVMRINKDYLKSLGGILALAETIVGIIVIGLTAGSLQSNFVLRTDRELYLLVVAIACLITTFLMFISNLCHLPTAQMLPKTLFEVLFNSCAFLMYLSAGIAVLATIHNGYYYQSRYTELLVAGIFAIINTILYLLSAIFWAKRP